VARADATSSLAVTGSASIEDALRFGISVLSESRGSGRADALILLAHVLARPREWIVAHDEALISEADFALFIDLCARRCEGEPVAYITGSAWFCGRQFIVDTSVLIPRAETEHLVEEAVRFMRSRDGACRVLDVGTGSGAIACSIATETGAHVEGVDVSPEALTIARRNAERLGVTGFCRFVQGNLADAVSSECYDVIVANLPYVPTADLRPAPDPTSFEPRIALDGGSDGLSLYREMMRDAPALVAADGIVLLEAAPPTIESLAKLTQLALPNFTVSVGHDYAGLARYVKAAGQS